MGHGGEELERVRDLRRRGLSPKEIARATGLPPARVTQLIKTAAATETPDPTQGAVVECWVSAGWSAGLTVTGHPEWHDEPDDDEAPSGLVGVLLARDAGRSRVGVCAWLVDVYCLGVKNDLGPTVTHRGDLPQVVRNFFAVFGTPPVAAPLELAQHLVLGALEYARGLGFEPAEQADFADTRGHLGPWQGPSANPVRPRRQAFLHRRPERPSDPRAQATGARSGCGQLPLHDRRPQISVAQRPGDQRR